MAPGVIALLVALAVAVVTGLAWQRTNGRMRGVTAPGGPAGAPQPPGAQGPGEQTPGEQAAAAQPPDPGPLITGADLGLPLGERATLVQFSTAFCAPCRATRQILAEVAGMTEGVAHVEIDAESHLDLVRRLDVRRTPTVLVVGPDGRIAKRASGQPRKADVIAALGDVGLDPIPTGQIGERGKGNDTEPGRA
jgi:thiol-disulfide isomerase/thioredoxin